MAKPWLGYVAAFLFLLAGIFQIIGQKYWIGALFIVVAVANVFIQIKLNKISKGNK